MGSKGFGSRNRTILEKENVLVVFSVSESNGGRLRR